jgi:hypothetical protein
MGCPFSCNLFNVELWLTVSSAKALEDVVSSAMQNTQIKGFLCFPHKSTNSEWIVTIP